MIEVLGRPGEFGVDVEILIRKHHLPHVFPTKCWRRRAAAAQPVGEAERDGPPRFSPSADRHDRRRNGARFRRRRLRRAPPRRLASAGAHRRRGALRATRNSPLDREARLRGTSVYFPDRAVPMLPEELSNGICSLKPHEDRLVMSALLDLDHDGEVTDAEFTPGVIRSAERMTYTDGQRRARRRRRSHRALRRARRTLPRHARSRVDPQRAPHAPRLDGFRSARARAHIRRRRADDRHRAQRAQHRASPDRRVHARRQSGRRAISRTARHCSRCIASTKSPIRRRCSNSRSWRRPSAIRSACRDFPSGA